MELPMLQKICHKRDGFKIFALMALKETLDSLLE
jgi:hypothetical protein